MEFKIDRPSDGVAQDLNEVTSSSDAERTKTPTKEARRAEHQKDRTDRFSVMGESTVKKFIRQAPSLKQEISSSGTDATRSSGLSRDEPDEQSQQIWVEELVVSPPSSPQLPSRFNRGSKPSLEDVVSPPSSPTQQFRVPQLPSRFNRGSKSSSLDTDATRTSTRTPPTRASEGPGGGEVDRVDLLDMPGGGEQPTILNLDP